MITLEQARTIVEQGDNLLAELLDVDRRLSAFQNVNGDVVVCRAVSLAPSEDDHTFSAYKGRASVEILPVPKAQAISAVLRERAKLVAKLAELGVYEPTPIERQPA